MHVPACACAGAVSTRPYLRAAAEVLARESCGEPWLLQPKVEDLELLEYRCGSNIGLLESPMRGRPQAVKLPHAHARIISA
jgi:hypothetical protein